MAKTLEDLTIRRDMLTSLTKTANELTALLHFYSSSMSADHACAVKDATISLGIVMDKIFMLTSGA